MAYVKQTWVDGPDGKTPIDAEHLDHIEEGILDASSVAAKATAYLSAYKATNDAAVAAVKSTADAALPKPLAASTYATRADLRATADASLTKADAAATYATTAAVNALASTSGANVSLFGQTVSKNALVDLLTGGVQLYTDGGTANYGNITLSQSAAGMAKIVIYYKNSDGAIGSTELQSPNGKSALLILANSNGSSAWIKMRGVSVSGTAISTTATAPNTQLRLPDGAAGTGDYIAITEVRGWRV